MSETQIRLTRDQLAEFLPNARAVKVFEKLMLMTGTLLPEDIAELQQLVEETNIDVGIANSKAELALSLLAKIESHLETIALAPNAKQDNTEVEKELELFALAPVPSQSEVAIPLGTTAQYWRGDKTWRDFMTDVLATTLAGLSTATNAVITAADTVLSALGKLQKQFSDHFSSTAAHGATGAVVGTTNVQTLTNKTLTTPIISTISNTGTLTFPTSTDTLVGRNTIDTLLNKTLDSPIISTISNTGTLTLPTSTDTLVGRNTIDNLLNKTLTSPVLTTPNCGTPSTLVGTNITGTGANFTAGNTLVSTVVALGYTTGSGGTVTQATNKSTNVTLNKPTGKITMNNALLASSATVAFGLLNSLITANDLIILTPDSTSTNYDVWCSGVQAGAAIISVKNISGIGLSEALPINFAIIKGSTS